MDLAVVIQPDVDADPSHELRTKLLPLATKMDELYNRFLDQYEQQIHSTSKINVSINELLQRSGEDQLLKWNPDASLSPRSAFISLADAVAKQAAPYMGLSNGRSGFRHLDLVDWLEPGYTAAMSPKAIQLMRVEYARTRCLVTFLDDLLVRYRPETVPAHAMSKATYDFTKTFAVPTPVGTVIPIKTSQNSSMTSYRFLRHDGEMMWYVLPRHLSAITRATNAIATMAILSRRPDISFGMGDMLNAIDHQLNKSMMRYEEGDYFQAGSYMRLFMHRDSISFHFGETTFKVIRENVEKHVSDIRFIEHG